MHELISQLKKSCGTPVSQSGPSEVQPVPKREKARERRVRELFALVNEGMPVVVLTNWLFRVGPLQIWTASGRWVNVGNGRRGTLRSMSMRELIEREADLIEAPTDPGNHARTGIG